MLAILFVYLFLVAEYESWTLPISIILLVMMGMFGAFAGLPLSVYAQLGLMLLVGTIGGLIVIPLFYVVVQTAVEKIWSKK